MTKKRLLITVIFALLIVALLIPAGAVLAQGDGPVKYRVREWGFYLWPGAGIYLGIPAQELNDILGTYIDVEVLPWGVPYGDIYPLAPQPLDDGCGDVLVGVEPSPSAHAASRAPVKASVAGAPPQRPRRP